MDKEEIKLRLAGYRPEIYDDDDPQIAEALELARADPELREWLEEEIAFDRRFAAALGATPSAPEAIDDLLTHARSAKQSRPSGRSRLPIFLAAAAVLVLGGFTVKYFLFPPAVQFPERASVSIPDFRDDMAYLATQRFILDKSTSDLEEARSWLVARSLPVYKATPAMITMFEGMGCKAIDWNGTKVSLVCFLNDDRDIVHLFVVDTAAFPSGDAPELGLPKRLRDLETQGWKDERHVYLFVGADPDVSLQGLL